MTSPTLQPQYHSRAASLNPMDVMLALCMVRDNAQYIALHNTFSQWPDPDLKHAMPLCHCSFPIFMSYISRANQTSSQETRVQSYDASSI